jgi:MFS family permease
MLSGFATGFTSLLVLRLLLGIGESVVFPAHACLLARGLPDHLRAWTNASVSISGSIGPSAGALIGGLMLAPMAGDRCSSCWAA